MSTLTLTATVETAVPRTHTALAYTGETTADADRVRTSRPICVDLFCGLGGWSEGFLAEGYQCWGFDIERHDYGTGGYPGDMVLADVLTLPGSMFRDAAVIVASPPCQEYSYMAMPWSRGKQVAMALREGGEYPDGWTGSRTLADLTALFDACFRIQREACEAAGRYIPMVVENVRGAQPWVGRSAWNYGSFHLWGDVPALMPFTMTRGAKAPACGQKTEVGWTGFGPGSAWREHHGADGQKVPGMNFHDFEKTGKPGRSFQSAAVADTFGWSRDSEVRRNSSHSHTRKAASAQIAKIPLALSRHIARVYKPVEPEATHG